MQTETVLPIREVEHFWIPIKGILLAARMWLPEHAEEAPVPAILEYIPYRKNDGTATRDALRLPYLASHGYAAVRVDVRGAGDSEGLMTDEYSPDELDDGCEVIAWIAKQPWCNGHVGMTGKSWGGFNCLQIAAMRPPALKAVIAVAFTDNRYTDDVHYLGGCVSASEMLSWASVMLSYGATPPDPRWVGDVWKDMWKARLEAQTPWVEEWLSHQTFDEYWQRGSVCVDYDAIEVPVYAVAGLSDGYSNSVLRMLENLDTPSLGVLGPWGHSYPTQGHPRPAVGFLDESLRWWDRWLKGVENGIEDEPQVTTWMLDGNAPVVTGYPTGTMRPGYWTEDVSWPSDAVTPIQFPIFNLDQSKENLRIDEDTPQHHGRHGGQWWGNGYPGELAGPQQQIDMEGMPFTAPPLKEEMMLLGYPELHLKLAVDQPEAFIVARLCDVSPKGESKLISYGVLNLAHREGHIDPLPVVPGEMMTFTLELNVCGYRVPAGHRLRITLGTAYWPLVWPMPKPVMLTLKPADCQLILPKRLPQPRDADLEPFGPPQLSDPAPTTTLRERSMRRHTHRSPRSGRWVYTREDDDGHIRFDANGLQVSHYRGEVYSILPDDPLSARVWITHEHRVRRGDWEVHIETSSEMWADERDFYLRNRVTAWDRTKLRGSNDPVSDRTWEKRMPRR
ncbi:MAG: CocE/NonD family hydrolase [Chloroflexota bacterium]